MTMQKQSRWALNNDWTVGTDAYNWILYRRSGKGWRPNGYYPSPELLLKSFHQILRRTEPHQPTVELHIAHCLELAQAATGRLLDQLADYPIEVRKMRPMQAGASHEG